MSKKEAEMKAEYVSIPLEDGEVLVQQLPSSRPSFGRRLCRSLVIGFVAYTLFHAVFCNHHHNHHHMRHHHTFDGEVMEENHHHPFVPPEGHHGPHHGFHMEHGHFRHPGTHDHNGHHHHPHGPHDLFGFVFDKGVEEAVEDEMMLETEEEESSSSDSSEEILVEATPSIAREDFVISEESP